MDIFGNLYDFNSHKFFYVEIEKKGKITIKNGHIYAINFKCVRSYFEKNQTQKDDFKFCNLQFLILFLAQ